MKQYFNINRIEDGPTAQKKKTTLAPEYKKTGNFQGCPEEKITGEDMEEKKLRVMFIGAHPDDAEGQFGGTAILFSENGHSVMLVSMTNGNCGHHAMGREELAERRFKEAQAAGRVIGAEYKVMPVNDGELMPSLENRKKLLRIIRKFSPDIIFTHSSAEYHPDHRYTNQLVVDTSYLVMVPNALSDSPPMEKNPCYFFSSSKPEAGRINVCIPIDSVWKKKLLAWHQHASQMYEWLPWVGKRIERVPDDEGGKLRFLEEWRGKSHIAIANNYRDILEKKYGEKAEKIRYAEGTCSAPVGRQNGMTDKEISTLFPFDPF